MQKYGTNPKLDKIIDNGNWEQRLEIAKQGYGLDKLINDEHYNVRYEVAKQGYGLDILINDEDWLVRAGVVSCNYGLDILINDKNDNIRVCVAEQRYGLEVLINDQSAMVRRFVAFQDYGLDKLINDDEECVRAAVAEQGYGLNKLINDESVWVRREVVEHGYGLNKLINDEDKDVRDDVNNYLKEHNYESVEDWAEYNPDKVYGKIDTIKKDVMDFIYKINDSSKLEVQFNNNDIKDFFTSNESDILVICTVDNKKPIIKIEKTYVDEKTNFKFIVDITNEDGDSFNIKTIIKSKEQLNKYIEQTIVALQLYKPFAKYADELEKYI